MQSRFGSTHAVCLTCLVDSIQRLIVSYGPLSAFSKQWFDAAVDCIASIAWCICRHCSSVAAVYCIQAQFLAAKSPVASVTCMVVVAMCPNACPPSSHYVRSLLTVPFSGTVCKPLQRLGLASFVGLQGR